MGYHLNAYTMTGDFIGHLGNFNNLTSARQAMLDHSDTIELPEEIPLYVPACGVIEGWFVGEAEYLIQIGV